MISFLQKMWRDRQTDSERSRRGGRRKRHTCLPRSFLLFSFSLAAKRAWARVLRPAVASPGNFLSVSQKNSSTYPYPGAWVPEAVLSCQESLGHRDALKELSPRSQSLPPSPGLLLLPRSRVQKALLLLGLNPVSASLQDQHCESLSLASNISDNGYRECLANGSWAARVNYSECQEILNEEKKSKVHYHVAVIINYLGHCISLVALLVAFVLFLRLRSIRCLRNIIHWNLISAFILRNATWFVVQLTMSPEVHQSNVGWCRLVTAAYNYFHVTNFFWMFGEGCYLHTAIVLTYSTDRLRKWMFICIGWGVPFPIIVAWAIGKLYYDNEKCWFGKRPGVYTDYIYQGPMILVLLINFIFLFNIVRILMTKLRASTTSETIQYRKAVKATLVLLPLLGITYMLFFVNPGEDEVSRVVFIYFNSFLESFQGFFVSVFYCFLNSEVRSAIRKRWHRWQDKHSIRARVARAMSIPTSPTRVSFHSIKQSTAV
ncbi:corticotropin-releasing factor receptor 1 isoform X4 [Macaca nemestrina]|uniref:corticotropin-releasing factor receptor 1 isoform X4 n=1 Tax=Macaca nemestrina TaxID=9545 RepID=UPI0005F4FD0A|nr:corticotropin-releasing factor receptor 1 isoform X4 [Macaca nemestrina]